MPKFDINKVKTILIYILAIVVAIIFIILSFYAFVFLIIVGLVVWLVMLLKRKFGKSKYYSGVSKYSTKRKKTIVIDMED